MTGYIPAPSGGSSPAFTASIGSALYPDEGGGDTDAVHTNQYSIVPVTIVAPRVVRGILTACTNTPTNGLLNRFVLYARDGQSILADTGNAPAPAGTSRVTRNAFVTPVTINTPGTYFMGLGMQDNGTYMSFGATYGRFTECYAVTGTLPATIDPNHTQVGSNTCMWGALY